MYPVPDDIFKEVKSLQSAMTNKGFRGFSSGPKGINIIEPSTTLTVKDLQIFIEALEKSIGLNKLDQFISKTEALRSKLKSKIMANVNSNDPDLAVLQYYSH